MARGGKRPGAGRPPGSQNKKTLARRLLAEEAAKGGTDPMVFMYRRMEELIKKGDDASKKEAIAIAVELLPYRYPRLSTTQVNAEIETTRNVIVVPEVSGSIEDWTKTYSPLVAALPTKEPN
jgi:hypothetical protein